MFFLLRCLFWLGLTFSHIAALEGTNATALASRGAREITEDAAHFGRMAADAASEKCRAEPEKCMTLVARTAALGNAAALGAKASSRDTLNTDDRIPAWRLRTE